MTALEKIKEIEEAVHGLIPGMRINKRWAPTGSVRAKPFRDDFEFLLKSFYVMRELTIQVYLREHGEDESYVDNKFEEAIK